MVAIRRTRDALAFDPDGLIRRLDRYLLSGAVCCPQTGAVYGVRGSTVDYAYPEIAGYYLTYLAGLAGQEGTREANREQLLCRAERVVRWLKSISRLSMPLTRYYHNEGVHDWRNDFVFTFDLAMVLRGLAHVRQVGLADWSAPEIADYLRAHVPEEDGRLRAVNARGASAPPSGWATRFDAYQLKTTAALASYSRQFPQADLADLTEEASAVFAQCRGLEFEHLPLHPRCYALEGVALLQGSKAHPAIARAVIQAMGEASPDWQRTDVLAQALRLCCLSTPDHPLNHELALTLAAQVVSDRGLGFKLDSGDPQRNTWCTLFVRQALAYYRAVANGEAIDVQFLI